MGFPDSSVGKKSVSRSVISDSTPNTVAYQALLSMGFSRQENWSGLPCPVQGGLLQTGIEPTSPAPPAYNGPIHHLKYHFQLSQKMFCRGGKPVIGDYQAEHGKQR